jgi:hypothetical protein
MKRIMVMLFVFGIMVISPCFSLSIIPDSPVPAAVVSYAGAKPRAKTYAESYNSIDKKTYEFMITRDGYVIYRVKGDAWKYFGDKGYSLDTVDFDNDYKPIGRVDMIAASGNRVFVKTRGSNLFYFAEIVNGNIAFKPDKSETQPGYPFFITSAPDDYSTDTNCDSYADAHILANSGKNIDPWLAFLLPLSKAKAESIISQILSGALRSAASQAVSSSLSIDINLPVICRETTLPLIPYSWPVVMEAKKWYRLKASIPNVIDIGASDVNKVEAARYANANGGSIEKYVKKLGGEYWREYQQPLINLKDVFFDIANNPCTVGFDNRNYGSLVDGIANYYVLTSESNRLSVLYIDEQALFSSSWYKFAENLEFSLDQQGEPLAFYHPVNWTKTNYMYRNATVILWLFMTYINVNVLNTPAYVNAWNYANDQMFAEESYKPEFAEAGKIPENPWLWSAQENVHQPELFTSDSMHSNLVPFFAKGQWDKVYYCFLNNTYFYSLQNRFRDGSNPLPVQSASAAEPSLAVSKVGNIAVCTSRWIYTLSCAWGNLDFSWHKRSRPDGEVGNNIMFRYSDDTLSIVVPGIDWNTNRSGYFIQGYLPKHFLQANSIRPTYNYIPATGTGIPLIASPEDGWDWISEADAGFTNSNFDF